MSPDEVVAELDAIVTLMGGTPRTGQEAMARAVTEAFNAGEHAVIQAGTGTGKSLAYLVPAAGRARTHGPVVIATATLALQRQLVERELPRLHEAGLETSWAVLKGRHNYVCRQRLGELDDPQQSLELTDASARGTLEEQAIAVHEWVQRTQTGDRDDLAMEVDSRVWRSVSVTSAECVGESRCAFGEECFAGQARIKAAEADIVVTNHAMVAIDAIESVPILPDHSALVIDEAHELIDRITAAVSRELAIPALERLAGDADRVIDDEAALSDATADLEYALRELPGEVAAGSFEGQSDGRGRVRRWPESMVLALTRLRDVCHAIVTALSTQGGATDLDEEELARRQRIRAGVQEVHEVATRFLALDGGDVIWWSSDGGRTPVVHAAPLDVAQDLASSLFTQGPVVLTSATLMAGGSFAPLLDAAGLAADTRCVDVGSGFDHARQGILYVASSVPAPGRDGVSMEALDELGELIDAAGGRALALFSSWRGVERAAEYLRVRLGPSLESGRVGPVLVHRRGESVVPLVEQFAAAPHSVLMGTVSLWQGIDVPGDSCVLVAIDRIPFPRPDDPVVAARQEAVDAAGGSGFRQVALARASLLMAQGAGRLIRSVDDRGVVAVLDPRMATAGYARALRASLPPLWFTTDRDVVIAALTRLADELSD